MKLSHVYTICLLGPFLPFIKDRRYHLLLDHVFREDTDPGGIKSPSINASRDPSDQQV